MPLAEISDAYIHENGYNGYFSQKGRLRSYIYECKKTGSKLHNLKNQGFFFFFGWGVWKFPCGYSSKFILLFSWQTTIFCAQLAAPEDHLLVSSSLDKTLRVWDLRRYSFAMIIWKFLHICLQMDYAYFFLSIKVWGRTSSASWNILLS